MTKLAVNIAFSHQKDVNLQRGKIMQILMMAGDTQASELLGLRFMLSGIDIANCGRLTGMRKSTAGGPTIQITSRHQVRANQARRPMLQNLVQSSYRRRLCNHERHPQLSRKPQDHQYQLRVMPSMIQFPHLQI